VFLFYLLIGFALVLLLHTVARWVVQAQPAQLVIALRWIGGIAGGLVGLWLILTGRLGQALMLASVMAPLFMRWKSIFTAMRNARGPSAGQSSAVETGWLRMSLDHDTGAMEGLVLQGRWKGRRLSELSAGDLVDLWAACRVHDAESAQLVEAYLDRMHPDWRAQAHAAEGSDRETPSGVMTRAEAAQILGVPPDADRETVRAAHRRLMQQIHPDRGGSDYLAAKVNQAKDVLLGT